MAYGIEIGRSKARGQLACAAMALMWLALAGAWAQDTMQNPYQALDDKARAANDDGAVRALTQDMLGRVLFAPLPTPLVERIIRAELTFKAGQSPAVTEEALADAVNELGRGLGGALYTGTNALQIRLLRVAMFADLPHLLNSPTPPPSTGLVGPDLSPAGATFLGFLLLRQKLANPAWFGNPDDQNEAWIAHKPGQLSQPSSPAVRRWPPHVPALIKRVNDGLADTSSPVTAAFHAFFDQLGFAK